MAALLTKGLPTSRKNVVTHWNSRVLHIKKCLIGIHSYSIKKNFKKNKKKKEKKNKIKEKKNIRLVVGFMNRFYHEPQ